VRRDRPLQAELPGHEHCRFIVPMLPTSQRPALLHALALPVSASSGAAFLQPEGHADAG
jgi:hypothetical protein